MANFSEIEQFAAELLMIQQLYKPVFIEKFCQDSFSELGCSQGWLVLRFESFSGLARSQGWSDCKSDLVKGHGSRPYKSTGEHLLSSN